MILLDTSVLIDCLTGPKRSLRKLRGYIEDGERFVIPSLVLYEWLRGPRTPDEIESQDSLFPAGSAMPFGPREAEVSVELYRSVRRARGREMDLAIAACAICKEASLWTLNPADFRDVPGLTLTE